MGSAAFAKTCIYVNSYHVGYEWSDGIEKSLEEGLKGKCDLIKFHMDTKQNPLGAKQKGEEAKAIIESKNPDVVILSDDNAVKYILMPFYKNSKIPFIYVGVNWTADAYALPYKNTTGMLEVSPIDKVAQELKAASSTIKKGVFLSSYNESEEMDAKFTKRLFKVDGLDMDVVLVKSMKDWKDAYKKAQDTADFVFLNNNSGIKDWNDAEAKATAEANIKKITTGIYKWMAPYGHYVIMKIPAEQGQFAAQAAIDIMGGKSPSSIPVEKNKKGVPLVNMKLVEKSSFKFSSSLMNQAEKL